MNQQESYMIGVSILSRAKKGQGDDLYEAWLIAAQTTVDTDKGCKVYHLTRTANDADLIAVFAIYESEEALAAHNASAQSKALLPPIMANSEGPPSVHVGPVAVLTAS
jgi:quinol monooxygenase YgiN